MAIQIFRTCTGMGNAEQDIKCCTSPSDVWQQTLDSE